MSAFASSWNTQGAQAQARRQAMLEGVARLRALEARSTHASDSHAPGTHEILVVLSGSLRLRLADEVHELAAGDTISFPADRPHAYENPGASEARYHNVIIYER